MSVRTFIRRVQAEVGTSPGQWVVQRRVDHARGLLETSTLSVDEVAGEAGFGSAALLRKHLHTAVGVTPTAYRRAFRPPPLSTAPLDRAAAGAAEELTGRAHEPTDLIPAPTSPDPSRRPPSSGPAKLGA